MPDEPLSFCYAGSISERAGALEFIRKCFDSDLVLLDAEVRNLLIACALKLLFLRSRLTILSVDIILRVPRTLVGRAKAFCMRALLRQVNRFILFFNNTSGCERWYGISRDRTIYVPFKVNGWEEIIAMPRGNADGDYVLCAGRTLRDLGTFVKAMEISRCPGVLLQQPSELVRAHGTAAWSEQLPPNVKRLIDTSDQVTDFLRFIANARLVIIPRFKHDIAPTGISTYLMAMALNKCVIISAGPGADDVLTDQAVIVPAENAERLSQEISDLWNDHQRRERVASRGYEYAMSLGGYERLLSDILTISTEYLLNLRCTDEHANSSSDLQSADGITAHTRPHVSSL